MPLLANAEKLIKGFPSTLIHNITINNKITMPVVVNLFNIIDKKKVFGKIDGNSAIKINKSKNPITYFCRLFIFKVSLPIKLKSSSFKAVKSIRKIKRHTKIYPAKRTKIIGMAKSI